SAVVGKNRSQLKGGKERILPGAVKYTGRHDFVSLIEFRKRAIGAQVRRILRSIVAVKISTGVESFAVGVVAKHGEMIAEALLDFENSGLIKGRTNGSIFIVLNDERIHKASEGSAGIGCGGVARQAFRTAERIGSSSGGVPVSVGIVFAIGQRYGAHGSRE